MTQSGIRLVVGDQEIELPHLDGPSLVSMSCQGESCFCGAAAKFKVEEIVFRDDPLPLRHPLTSYLCHPHFVQIMGLAAR